MHALTLSEAHEALEAVMLTIDAVARVPRAGDPQEAEAVRGRGRAHNDPTGCPEGCSLPQGVRVLCTRDDGHDGHHMHVNGAGLITAEWWFEARKED